MRITPPASKKRRNVEEDSSTEQNHAKGARTNDGGRRGLGGGGAPSSSSSSPAGALVPVRGSATHRLSARQKKYYDGMAVLNFQMKEWAQAQLASPGSIPDDGLYFGRVDHYVRLADDLRRRFDRAYGDIVVFGAGDCGQLGCGEGVTESRKPRLLMGLRGVPIDQMASGGLHSLALTEGGEVYSWGCNDQGSLGWNATEEKDDGAVPSFVRGFHPSQYGPNGVTDAVKNGGAVVPLEQRKEAVITQIAAGETQSLALDTEGNVYMWGAYKDNEGRAFRNMPPRDDIRKLTGNKDMDKLEEDDDPEWFKPPRGNQDWPMHLVEMTGKAKDISAGAAFNAALMEDGTIQTWGIGQCGELARPVSELTKKTSNEVVKAQYLKPQSPVWDQPALRPTVMDISCGGYHLLVVTQDKSVYSSGLNNYGQLGHGDTDNRETLTKIQHFEEHNITKVEGGMHFSCFLNNTGKELYTCGRGDYGSLGITLEQAAPGYLESLPIRVPLVYSPRGVVSEPKENSIIQDDIVEEEQPEIEQVSCGDTHILVLTKGGDAYSWGFGTSGACGQGKSDDDVLRPKLLEMKVKSNQGTQKKVRMRYVSGGGQHSTAIVTTGST